MRENLEVKEETLENGRERRRFVLVRNPQQTARDRAERERLLERLDGKYLLSTTDPSLSAEDVALGYKELAEVERGFRTLKSTLDLSPLYHRLAERIEAHVLLCWLALLLVRLVETETGRSWEFLVRS